MAFKETIKMHRRDAVGMEELVRMYIRDMKLEAGLNRQRIFTAWNDVSGAARYTTGLYFKNGCLYCTLSSSVVRNQLYFQRDAILKGINEYLAADTLFVNDGKEGAVVKNIVLR